MSRPVPVPTRALVVRLADYGDTDRIVGLFTRSRGLVSAIAKSARVSTKRFGGALQSGQLLDVVFGRSGGALERLESATIVDAHLGLLTDLAKLDEARERLRRDDRHAECGARAGSGVGRAGTAGRCVRRGWVGHGIAARAAAVWPQA